MTAAKLTVLGLGNILMLDEGLGVYLMEAVRDRRNWPEDIEFIDGGTGGLGLIDIIEKAQRLIVFDAADMNLPAGQYRVIRPEQLENTAEGRVSLHQMPFVETLALCEKFFRRPPLTVIFAVQPAEIAYGKGLSEEINAKFDILVHEGLKLAEQLLGEAAQE